VQRETGAGVGRHELDSRRAGIFERAGLESGDRFGGVFIANGLDGERVVVLLLVAADSRVFVNESETDVRAVLV
jgi:DNA-directed RNA polymerase beta subunit